MSEFVEVGKVDEIPPGTAAVIEVEGMEIAVVNVGGEFYAVQNECTHAAAPVGDGDLVDDYALECPSHGSVFDVRTGEPLKGPADEPLVTYEIRVEEGIVKVLLD